jgi:hypothetical protein
MSSVKIEELQDDAGVVVNSGVVHVFGACAIHPAYH